MAIYNRHIKPKLPTKNEILSVFSLGLVIIFSWVLYRLFWHIPSWLYYLNIYDVLIICAYSLSFAFLESVFISTLPVLLSIIYPKRLYKSYFTEQGFLTILFISIIAILIQRKMRIVYSLNTRELLLYSAIFLFSIIIEAIIFPIIFKQFPRIAVFIKAIADKCTVFLIIYIPISIISFIVVLIRNL